MKITQKTAVLNYLKGNGSITATEAIRYLSITRLANVIYKLKKEGVKIETSYEHVDTTYGKTRIATYRIIR